MTRHLGLLALFYLALLGFCVESSSIDNIKISSLIVKIDNTHVTCDKTTLLVDGKEFKSTCSSDGTNVFLFPAENSFDNKNLTFQLTYKSIQNPLTGIFVIDESAEANQLLRSNVTLTEVVPTTTSTKKPDTTTTAPKKPAIIVENDDEPAKTTTAPAKPPTTTTTPPPVILNAKGFIYVNWMHLKFDETPIKKEVNNNGAAVTVAVLEGIALIAILGYLGYQTMQAQKIKNLQQNVGAYGYENNANSLRMSDIPPPREPRPPQAPVLSPVNPQQSQSRIRVSQPDLVVPSTTPAGAAPVGTFNDPFSSLDSW